MNVAPDGVDFEDASARAALIERPTTTEFPSVFPLAAYGAWLDRLQELNVRFITFGDLLDKSRDFDHEHGYPDEWARWRKRRDTNRIEVLIQHDVDFVPDFTRRMMAMEAERGIRSSVFVFNELANDFPPGTWYDDTPYHLDDRFLRGAQQAGFVIGYHQNVVPRCDGTMDGAVALFRDDVRALRERFDIRYFCPHGGRGATVDGEMRRNHEIDIPDDLRKSLRWIYNRYALRWSGRWSDGGIRRTEDPERLDALDLMGSFTPTLEPGNRYFVLVHPQWWGYNVDTAFNPALSARPWFRQMLEQYG